MARAFLQEAYCIFVQQGKQVMEGEGVKVVASFAPLPASRTMIMLS